MKNFDILEKHKLIVHKGNTDILKTTFHFFSLKLVGGSAGTEQTDERENAPDGEATVAKNADGYTEGIPIN